MAARHDMSATKPRSNGCKCDSHAYGYERNKLITVKIEAHISVAKASRIVENDPNRSHGSASRAASQHEISCLEGNFG
jgi:hypothetical protein